MKKLLVLAFVILGLNVYSQDDKPVTKNPDQKTIDGTLYTDKEREQLVVNFLTDANQKLNLTPEVQEKYSQTIYDTYNKMLAMRKNRNLTKRQAKNESKKVFSNQDSKLKEILTPEQLQKHHVLFQPVQQSIFYRIDNY